MSDMAYTEPQHHLTHYAGETAPQVVDPVTEYRVVIVSENGSVLPASGWHDTLDAAVAHYDAIMRDWHAAAQRGEELENGRHLQIHQRTVTTICLRGCVVSPGR